MESFEFCFIIHMMFCSMIVAVIWVIQILHYPTFLFIESTKFPKFHRFHSTQITYIVAPIMVLELLTASCLLFLQPNSFLIVSNLILLILIWFFTFLMSVPFHNRLKIKKDDKLIEKLILTNWPRTVLWSIRLILLLFHFFSSRYEIRF